MPRAKVYYAHPYKTRGTHIEERIIDELKSRRLIIHEPFTKEAEVLSKYGVEEYYERPYFELARDIWTKDRGRVIKSDIIVAHIPDDIQAIGTAMEVAIAYEFGKFIQIISPMKHPSFALYADQLFETVEDWERKRIYKWENYEEK